MVHPCSLKLCVGGKPDKSEIAPQFADLLNSLTSSLRELDLLCLPLPRMKLDLPQLQMLSLNSSGAVLESCADGLPFLFAGCRQLREIRVFVCDVFGPSGQSLDAFLQSLAACLERNDTVHSLMVAAVDCKVEASASTWAKLAEALRHHPKLYKFSLGSSNLGDQGMLAMQVAVQHNKNIFTFSIEDTDLSETGVRAFMDIEQMLEQHQKRAEAQAQARRVGLLHGARVAAAAAPRPVERKEEVEVRFAAPAQATAASSSTDKPTAEPAS